MFFCCLFAPDRPPPLCFEVALSRGSAAPGRLSKARLLSSLSHTHTLKQHKQRETANRAEDGREEEERRVAVLSDTTSSCIVCKKAFKYTDDTTNLYNHMKNHVSENAELQKRREEERHLPLPGPDRPRPPTQRQRLLTEAFQSAREYSGR